MIAEGAQHWWEVGRALDAAEQFQEAVANDLALLVHQAVTTLAYVRVKQEMLQTYLRERLGVELDDSLSEIRLRVVDEDRARTRKSDEVGHRYDGLISLMTYNFGPPGDNRTA
jgi:hypothetical protein